MRLEDMKQEFPEMPQEMRAMIEREVEKQVKLTSATQYHKNKRLAKRTLIASLVAAMALGTTVFAGALYQMHNNRVGNYGVQTTIEGNQETGATEAAGEIVQEIPTVKMEAGYLPEGMAAVEEQKFCYEDTPYQGGVSILFYAMDTREDNFEMLTGSVLESEECEIGGRAAIYMLLNDPLETGISFNQRIYVVYSDVHYVMEMYIGSDVPKEEAVKIAENIRLIPVENGTETEGVVNDYTWSEYMASLSEAREMSDMEEFSDTTVSIDEMKNTHSIGEQFSLTDAVRDTSESGGIEAKVAQVEVLDNINILDMSVLDEDGKRELQKETDTDGNLLSAELQYVKWGDGIDTLTEVVDTREVTQKLVYVTVEYTNTGKAEVSDVLFMGSLVKMKENGNRMQMYYGEESPDGTWDSVNYVGAAMHKEMWYYDVHGGERGNNYIAGILPGETVTVHMAWVVPEEELDLMYLNLDSFGGPYEFDAHSLMVGYVDIRQ